MEEIRYITIRDVPLSYENKVSKESIAEWLSYSLGLSGKKDKVVKYILVVLLDANYRGEKLSFDDIHLRVNKYKTVDKKVLYYHLEKMMAIGFLNRKAGKYFLGDGVNKNPYQFIYESYKHIFDRAFEKVKEALNSYYSKL